MLCLQRKGTHKSSLRWQANLIRKQPNVPAVEGQIGRSERKGSKETNLSEVAAEHDKEVDRHQPIHAQSHEHVREIPNEKSRI